MAVFGNSDQLKNVMLNLWGRIKADEDMSAQLIRSRLVVQFKYREPEGVLTVDASNGQELLIEWGECMRKPVIEMSMKSDVAHEFWLGKVSVPVAILTGKMISRGPTPKALALLPVIRPAFAFYPQVFSRVIEEKAKI